MDTLLEDLDAPLRSARPRATASITPAESPSAAPVARDPRLRRRVLSRDEYAEELRRPKLSEHERITRYGTPVVPVPVVLARGETEEEYEEAFRAWLRGRGFTLADLEKDDPNRERTLRISFANSVLQHGLWHKRRSRSRSRSRERERERETKETSAELVYIDERGRVDPSRVPHHLTIIPEYTTLEQFREDTHQGRFRDLTHVSLEEKQRLFGSPYAPISVPLAQGETKEEYEARFVQWLEKTEGLTLAEVRNHKIRLRERHLRMEFANLNRKGDERFVSSQSIKRDRVAQDEPVEKKRRVDCTGNDSLDVCQACGCRRCLVTAMRLLSEKITSLEREAKAHACTAEPMDLTTDGDEKNDTTIEDELVREYETINEMIIMNEDALAYSAAELVTLAANDMAEATRRRDEDNELQGLIDEESERRSVALAKLVVFIYRHRLEKLAKIIDTTPSSQATHVQKLGHRKCAQLAGEISETRARLEALREDPQRTKMEHLGATLSQVVAQRQRQWLTTLRFDERAQAVVRDLLKRVEFR